MRALALAMALALTASTSLAADAPTLGSIQSAIAYAKRASCQDQEVGVAELGSAYFGGGKKTLQEDIGNIFTTCNELKSLKLTGNIVVVFLAKPTVGAPQSIVAHFIFSASAPVPLGSAALPGVEVASWIYITEDDRDVPISQIVATPVDNPLLAQIGPLAAAVDKVLPLNPGQKTQTLYVHVAAPVAIPFRRSTIVESDFIATPRRNTKGELVDDKGALVKDPVFQQISGTVSFANMPKTWVTANATAAVLAGPFRGDQKMKVDNKAYASDPPVRGTTMAGLTFHLPFDSTRPGISGRERFGLFVGGVLTPAGGIALGGTIGARTVALVGGYAWLFIHTAPPGKAPGASVDADANPQLVSGVTTAWFVGATYAFK